MRLGFVSNGVLGALVFYTFLSTVRGRYWLVDGTWGWRCGCIGCLEVFILL